MYIYETHMHTCTASACGHSKGYEYISLYKELGYAGVFITDHFFNGNSCIPADLPWNERIELFCKGYEEAKAEGDKQDFQVFFGFEFNFEGDEFLIYGLDKKWLLDHPDLLSWDHIKLFNEVKMDGGLVVQAHPFRERGYLSKVSLHPHQCDAWEIANAGNPSEQDQLAYRYAKKHGIPMTAGSDIHLAQNAGEYGHFGVAFDTPLSSPSDYVSRIRKGEGTPYIPADRVVWQEGSKTHLPVYLYDENNIPHLIEDFQSIM